MPLFGAHVSGGIKGGLAKADEIQVQAIQVFVGSPQSWKPPTLDPADVSRFRSGVSERGVGAVFVHALYLVNLAAQREDIYRKSIEALSSQLQSADLIGAHGLIFHTGSAGSADLQAAKDRVVRALEIVLDGYSGECRLLLETCAGQGATIGRRLVDLADIIAGLGFDRRLGVCLDTCHVYSAGFDLRSGHGLEALIQECCDTIGLDRLHAIHANDSKTPLGSNVDRHENIGRGTLGEEAFARILNHPAFASLPFILEVPGLDGKGPDLANVQMLQRLASPVGVTGGSAGVRADDREAMLSVPPSV